MIYIELNAANEVPAAMAKRLLARFRKANPDLHKFWQASENKD